MNANSFLKSNQGFMVNFGLMLGKLLRRQNVIFISSILISILSTAQNQAEIIAGTYKQIYNPPSYGRTFTKIEMRQDSSGFHFDTLYYSVCQQLPSWHMPEPIIHLTKNHYASLTSYFINVVGNKYGKWKMSGDTITITYTKFMDNFIGYSGAMVAPTIQTLSKPVVERYLWSDNSLMLVDAPQVKYYRQ